MTAGPSPTLNGALALWPDTTAPRIIDSNGDVNNLPPGANSSGPAVPQAMLGGGGGGGGDAGSSGGGSNSSGRYSYIDSGGGGSGGSSSRYIYSGGGQSCGSCGCSNDGGDGPSNPGSNSGGITLPTSPPTSPWPGFPPGSGTDCGDGLCWVPSQLFWCVTPDTRISLFPHGCKAAGELEIGDTVVTIDENGELVGEAINQVVEVIQEVLAITTSDGRRLTCSPAHECMVRTVAGEAHRRRAKDLLTGDRLLVSDGGTAVITDISELPAGPVVRISMEGPNHKYLTEGIWSHNKSVPLWPP